MRLLPTIIAILSLLFWAFCAFDLAATLTNWRPYQEQYGGGVLASLPQLPEWRTALWGVGVGLGFIGSLLMFARLRAAGHAFLLAVMIIAGGLIYDAQALVAPSVLVALSGVLMATAYAGVRPNPGRAAVTAAEPDAGLSARTKTQETSPPPSATIETPALARSQSPSPSRAEPSASPSPAPTSHVAVNPAHVGLPQNDDAFAALAARLEQRLSDGGVEAAEAMLAKLPPTSVLDAAVLHGRLFIAGGRRAEAEQRLTGAEPAAELVSRLKRCAEICGTSGKPAEGVILLEIGHMAAGDKQNALEAEISEYRAKHGLGNVWSFFAADANEPFLELSDVADIRAKLIAGEIRRKTRARRNHVGAIQSADDLLAREPTIDLLLHPIRHHAATFAAGAAILGFLGFCVFTFYVVGQQWEIRFFQTTAFALCYIGLVFGIVRGKLWVALIAGFGGALLSQGHLNGALAMGGFVSGNPLSNGLAALVIGLAGALAGALMGLVRATSLPRVAPA